VNPALAAGLNAVFVPHDLTWVLEHEEIAKPEDAAGELLVLERFADLRQHF
jgi:putative hydrolase of the HAD superfamily